ncbi:baseplate assembly protein [Luteibacter sp. NPDC031894]|uniref:baseplate assembly protein n=1 Tax=Luteibacter sp. NPDC031894 TaxID=3390572 RepID=UPI003D07ACF4
MTTAIQLNQLPPPDVIEALDLETIYATAAAKLEELWAEFDPTKESSLPAKVLQVISYVALMTRQRVNDAARAVMLPFAKGKNLDNLGALLGVLRLVITPADPDNGKPDPVMEDDGDYLERILLAPSSFSVAGPEAAYVYHARSASGDVLDASATSPEPDDIKALVNQVLATHGASAELVTAMNDAMEAAAWPGQVFVSVLSRKDTGEASADLLETVNNTVSAESVRPMTDYVTVQSAEILPFAVDADMWSFAGPDSSVAMAAAETSLNNYLAASRRMGRDITLSGLYAALQVAGIQNVIINEPSATIVVGDTQAAYCTSITLNYRGIGE